MIRSTPTAIARNNLLKVAQAIEEFDHTHDLQDPGEVTMHRYDKPCGSPACALGHYAARPDLQDVFVLYTDVTDLHPRAWLHRKDDLDNALSYNGQIVCRHFGITICEADMLFSSEGCRTRSMEKVTPRHVSVFIRRFVKAKWYDWPHSGASRVVGCQETTGWTA